MEDGEEGEAVVANQKDLFGFIPPHLIWSYSRTGNVSGTAVDDEYNINWLTDGRGSFPILVDGNSGSWTVVNTAALIDTVAICNHRVKVDVAVSGGISGTILPAVAEVQDILLNPFLRVAAPASTSSLTISISGNSEDIIIGELVAGPLQTIRLPFWEDESMEERDFSNASDDDNGIPPYDEGEEGRIWTGRQIYTTAELTILRNWRKAQRGASLPSLIIPELAVNDAWLGRIEIVGWSPAGGAGLWRVEFRIIEYKRSRW